MSQVVVVTPDRKVYVNAVLQTVEVTTPGPAGAAGIGVPTGGTIGQVLTKKSGADYDTEWSNETGDISSITATAPLTGGGTSGDVTIGLSTDGNLETVGGSLKVTDTLNGIDKIAWDTLAGQTALAGQMVWNETDGTLDIGLKGGNVTLQVGQEQVQLAKNADNAGLVEGTAVYVVGSDGQNLTVRYAQANAELTSSKTFGVVTESASGGNKAFVTTWGMVRGLNTSTLTEGAAVWLSPTTAGGLTTTKPSAPNHLVLIGWCIRQHATVGVILVHVQNGYELDELHDVSITSPANNQVLMYESATHLWKNKPLAPVVSYVHQQGTASAIWTVNHNLGFNPNVKVIDSGGTNVEGAVAYSDSNSLTLTFTAAFAGTAYLS